MDFQDYQHGMGFDSFVPVAGPCLYYHTLDSVPLTVPTWTTFIPIYPHPISYSSSQPMSVLFLSMTVPMCRRCSWTSWSSAWKKSRRLEWERIRAGTASLSSRSLVGPSRGLKSQKWSSLFSNINWHAFWIDMAMGHCFKSTKLLRTKIDGAKAKCKSLGDTHFRRKNH